MKTDAYVALSASNILRQYVIEMQDWETTLRFNGFERLADQIADRRECLTRLAQRADENGGITMEGRDGG
jgi:hypothetical protein